MNPVVVIGPAVVQAIADGPFDARPGECVTVDLNSGEVILANVETDESRPGRRLSRGELLRLRGML